MLQYIFFAENYLLITFPFVPEFKVNYKGSKSDAGLYWQAIFHQQSQSSSDIEKKYICNVCNRAFAKKTYLDTHYRTHTGSRPYGCKFCGKFFTQKSSLNRHVVLIHQPGDLQSMC